MKIAIIEDRLGRLEQFVEFDLLNCKEITIISDSDFDKLIMDLALRDTRELNQYDCIAFHKSTLSNVVRDVLKEYCKMNKKPLIFFSGGITLSVYKDGDFPYLHINSKEFYSPKLRLFIENSKLENRINLLVLQFGQHWKLSLLLDLRNKISVAQSKLNLKNSNPNLELHATELIRRIGDLKISSLIKTDLIDENTGDILTGDESLPISSEQIGYIKSAINHLINKLV